MFSAKVSSYSETDLSRVPYRLLIFENKAVIYPVAFDFLSLSSLAFYSWYSFNILL